jgi:hypothetical protein
MGDYTRTTEANRKDPALPVPNSLNEQLNVAGPEAFFWQKRLQSNSYPGLPASDDSPGRCYENRFWVSPWRQLVLMSENHVHTRRPMRIARKRNAWNAKS